MRKRRLFLCLIGVALLVGVIVVVFSPEREPEYEEIKLSEWLEQTHFLVFNPGGISVTPKKAVHAIRQIGTNALPWLVQWIRYDQPAWKARLYQMINSKLRWNLFDKRVARAEGALGAFAALGPEAKGAIPQLTRVLI